jgi:hypothetical protein
MAPLSTNPRNAMALILPQLMEQLRRNRSSTFLQSHKVSCAG